jgi:hypothetical protein
VSGRLKITFTSDMPPAAVEVVAPDYSTVERLWLAPGEDKAVDVPSEGSFLRVHLASGEVVTLRDPGNLDRTISPSHLLSQRSRSAVDPSPGLRRRSRREVQRRAAEPVLESGAKSIVAKSTEAMLEGGLKVTLADDANDTQSGEVCEENTAVVFKPSMSYSRYLLTLEAQDMRVRVRLPGSVREVTVRTDELEDGQRVASVRVKTSSAQADAIAGYLHRGDLHSALAMTDWAEKAEQMLHDKKADPFAAAVGAFVLLRLRQIELLHNWTENLKNWFPQFSDPKIIRAWHLIYVRGDEATIRDLFAEALDDTLPVFTEGLRLLSEGVRILGKDAEPALEKLNKHVRRALNRSPFTATVERSDTATPAPFDVDIDYAALS